MTTGDSPKEYDAAGDLVELEALAIVRLVHAGAGLAPRWVAVRALRADLAALEER